MEIIKTNLNFKSMTKREKTEDVFLHHAACSQATVEQIHQWHLNNGWSGVGYHLYVRKDGTIYEGRPLEMVGAHAYGSNYNSIGICCEGNFEVEQMTDEQVKSVRWLLNTYLKEKYGELRVRKHSDVCKTSCPGKNYRFDEVTNAKVEVQTTKSIVDLANEVIAGKYGVGEARKEALGSLYSEVQAKVNEILLGKKTTTNKKSNEKIADEVIAGKWGNNPSRKEKLTKAGYDANAIQKIVNNKLR